MPAGVPAAGPAASLGAVLTPPLLKEEPLRFRSSSFRELLERQAAEVEALTPEAIRLMLPALHQLEAELTAELDGWLTEERWDEMLARWGGVRSASALAQARRTIAAATPRAQAASYELGRASVGPMTAAGLQAARLGLEHLVRQVEGRAQVAGSWIRLDLDTAAMFDGRRLLLVQRFQRSARRYGVNAIEGIRGQLQVGMLHNETYAELTRRLMALGRRKGELVAVTGGPAVEAAKGLWRQQRNNAWRLVRTEGQAAYNESKHMALRRAAVELPGLKRQWDAAADARVCAECRRLDGEIRALGAAFSSGDMDPPAHPNCRCSELPYHADWTNQGEIADAA